MDLFVNGTSVASGVGTGGEKFKGLGDGDITTSWAHFLANKLNCDHLWNHSLPSKPMSFTIADTMGFCEQYYEKYGTYENLFVAIEWLMPQAHGQWAPVCSDSPQYSNQRILPVVISWPETPTVYETMYMCKPNNANYLTNKSVYDLVHWKYINQASKEIHEHQRDQYYSSSYSVSLRLVEAAQEILQTKQWLNHRNISYVMFWAFGIGRNHGLRKLMTRALLPHLEKTHTFIPVMDFSTMDYGAEHSVNPVRGHPDIHGQKYIADYLYDYVIQHQLLPTTTLIRT